LSFKHWMHAVSTESDTNACTPADPRVVGVFGEHPDIQEVLWDGKTVSVDGRETGTPEIFEPLWDILADTDPIRFSRVGQRVVVGIPAIEHTS